MKSLLISGMVLGLSAGLSPGPMLTLVVSQTLRYGIREGVKVALAPLLTDIPIVMACGLFLYLFADMARALGVISIFGGLYLFYLGLKSLWFKDTDLQEDVDPKSLKKGLMINFLNPAPYLFWTSIGGHETDHSDQVTDLAVALFLFAPPAAKEEFADIVFDVVWFVIVLVSAAAFIFPFYVLLVGSKIVVAIVSGRSRNLLKSRHYRMILRILGLVLIGFGVLFLRDGINTLR